LKKNEILSTLHDVQLTWLDNQVLKIHNGSDKSFKDTKKALDSYKLLKNSLIPSNEMIEDFMIDHLSESGTKKLLTTLRVYVKRNSSIRLQVELTSINKYKLDNLSDETGLSKIEIINRLISRIHIDELI